MMCNLLYLLTPCRLYYIIFTKCVQGLIAQIPTYSMFDTIYSGMTINFKTQWTGYLPVLARNIPKHHKMSCFINDSCMQPNAFIVG